MEFITTSKKFWVFCVWANGYRQLGDWRYHLFWVTRTPTEKIVCNYWEVLSALAQLLLTLSATESADAISHSLGIRSDWRNGFIMLCAKKTWGVAFSRMKRQNRSTSSWTSWAFVVFVVDKKKRGGECNVRGVVTRLSQCVCVCRRVID